MRNGNVVVICTHGTARPRASAYTGAALGHPTHIELEATTSYGSGGQRRIRVVVAEPTTPAAAALLPATDGSATVIATLNF